MPVFEAWFILVIARATGWSEAFIRWRLPLQRAWPYYHAAMMLEGATFRWGNSAAEESWWQRIRRRFSPF